MEYWNLWIVVGEFFGSLILTLGVLIVVFISNQKDFGLKISWQKRTFLSLVIILLITLAIITAKGIGGYGQINPAATIMMAIADKEYKRMIAIIGFQILGGLIGGLLFLLFTKTTDKFHELKNIFNFHNQPIKKSFIVEFIASLLWLIPIAATVVAYRKSYINYFELAVTVSFARGFVIGTFEEMGVGILNLQLWLSMLMVKFIVQKRKVSKKQILSSFAGVSTNLGVGAMFGFVTQQFI